ncbi:CDP-diacylglycerol--glycerol-3-phosphate 3-phosphatidyltransferase [Posidoniimonas corsicana]|uniref:CDP-diacylglycerol--glycerol-3-phosphate 3-phosphatidyltransferase n=1 Tax=Posidoniimonas corsicana TaxID=1938618 RepID=A0A5C5VFA1_9BACT|nr:CDP-diacylglycerol--glycerol-3-phosphate 3-phosphatidyltransferase [Posidoniimonas corsicana]TWT36385.1 CDP-diacylglycerol--glycerol-3-phosphate 3-phosphatidyltransferase [Posidoniimonas corsicana]
MANVWNVPNTLSAARIVMAVLCFAGLELGFVWAALALYVVATATDWLDGYWARKYGQVTQLGRILDPFADKLLVCGAFVYLAAAPGLGVAPWMAVVVLSRELLVTALRSFVEGSGGDFSAKWVGKWKMALQCAAIIIGLILMALPTPPVEWLRMAFLASLWGAVAITLYSGVVYVQAVVAFARGGGR